jgi:hemerythrin-like domain-containing protein
MQALDTLGRDHQMLGELAEALGAYVSALEAGQPLRDGDLKELVESLRAVTEYRHFEKEEALLVPTLVRHGFDYNHVLLDGRRREFETQRYLLDVLHQSAERELNWTLDERERIARAARGLVEGLRQLASQEEAELFPEIVARLTPAVLGQLTEQLCQFDEQTAARWPGIDIASLHRSVLARYASTLPPSPEIAL